MCSDFLVQKGKNSGWELWIIDFIHTIKKVNTKNHAKNVIKWMLSRLKDLVCLDHFFKYKKIIIERIDMTSCIQYNNRVH